MYVGGICMLVKCPFCNSSVSAKATFCAKCNNSIKDVLNFRKDRDDEFFSNRKSAEKAGSKVMGTVGGILEYPFRVVSDLSGSDYIGELGETVSAVTKRTGEAIGSTLDGVADIVVGVAKQDEKRSSRGMGRVTDNLVNLGTGIASGSANLAKTVACGGKAAFEGDTATVVDSLKKIGKVITVASVAVTVGKVVGGIDDFASANINIDDNIDDGLNESIIDNDDVPDDSMVMEDIMVDDTLHDWYDNNLRDVDKPFTKELTVIKETATGRNVLFRNEVTGEIITVNDLVDAIENTDNFPNIYTKVVNGMKIPATNPNGTVLDNLG